MRVTYAARSFLDYRVPVFRALNERLEGDLTVIFSADYVPSRVARKAQTVLGSSAVGMTGELCLGPRSTQGFANRAVRVVYQPGIMQAILHSRPDVLVGDGFFQWTSFALAYRLRYGTPLVVCYERTFHTERNAQWLRTFYRRQVLRFVDAMSVNGELSQQYSEWLGMPAARITRGHMVADTEGLARSVQDTTAEQRRTMRERFGNPQLLFLGVGQLIERKGWKQLLLAWASFEKKHPEASRLVLIGEGPEEGHLMDLTRSLGVEGVILEGRVGYDDLATYYASADVFLIPTLEDNWSLVVPEAMACGLPVLCSCYNGCYPELVEDYGNGWVFDPLDMGGTVQALERCFAQRQRLPAMGARSLAIIAEHTAAHAADAILHACHIATSHRRP